ncbi:YtxH domain-containing protein [Halorientalis sp. IM1011]|uniref:YtxH domain-containing protein n=1 Tax=Halorientalis sp. IM1011 TaxID=1932360 RepID=UPI0015615F28|nr:YtxH domain-containing protein [Halorientalis sp. IM1011]
MSDKTDDALERVRDAFDSAVEETEQMSESAKQEVRDAIDDLEGRIEGLRNSN